MDKKVIIHTFWGFFTVATFWIGTLLAPSSIVAHKNNVQREKNEDTPNQRGVSLSLMRGTGTSTPSKSSSSSDPELEVLSRGLAGRVKSSSSSANSPSIFESPSKRPPLSKTEIKNLVDLAIKSSAGGPGGGSGGPGWGSLFEGVAKSRMTLSIDRPGEGC